MPSLDSVWPLRPPVAVAVAVKRGLIVSIRVSGAVGFSVAGYGRLPGFYRYLAGSLPVGAAEARAARRALGVSQGVLAQTPLQRQAHRLGQPGRRLLEARDDRIGLERVAGREARPDEVPGRLAVVVEAPAPGPHQGPLVGVDAVAELERGQFLALLAHVQIEVIVVEPAPHARRVVL